MLNKPWYPIAKYRLLPLHPLPLPPKNIPHKLGYLPNFLKKK